MVTVRLKHIHVVKKRTKAGIVAYHYAWRGGPRLVGAPGSPEYLESYRAAHGTRKPAPTGNLAAIIRMYRLSPEYARLGAHSKRSTDRYLADIEHEFGSMPYATLESVDCRKMFNAWRDSMADKPRTADYAISTLKTVIDWAHDRVIIRFDHAKPIKRLYRSNRADSIWTAEEIKTFHKEASPELGWALDLAIATGLRQSDLIRLSWNHREGNSIQVRTSKRGKTVNIPLTREAIALLDRIEVRGPVILTNARTKTPWTADGLRASFRQVCKDAKVNRTFHDLRRTAATRLVSAGLSSGQVASIMGWSEDDVESMKRKYVSRAEVAAAALAKLENGV